MVPTSNKCLQLELYGTRSVIFITQLQTVHYGISMSLGYPAPELKWYKDDMEMDRYCGLPKYEIHRHGKIHTLHIYKYIFLTSVQNIRNTAFCYLYCRYYMRLCVSIFSCTLDDAAIYQVSASNSKGIVSCSGVLEVGTMNEFKIHQRFFAKLKEKAEKKKLELEMQTKKEDKETNQNEKPQVSPEPPPRKRHIPPPEESPVVKEPQAVEQLGAAETNGVSSEVNDMSLEIPKDSDLSSLSKKKIKISNGVDAGVNSSTGKSNMMGNGGENCYDGGISLAQFLAETLQSQDAEEKQSSPRGEKPKEMDIPVVSASIEKEREKEREQEAMRKEREEQERAIKEEYEREKRREEQLAIEREKEYERMSRTAPHTKHGSEVKHHSKAHKDHEHHHIQASISSMLHSVKDFLFGKTKKDSHDHAEKEREFDHLLASAQPPQPETPPSFRLQQEHNQNYKPLTEEVVPMEMDKPKEPSKTMDIKQQSVSLQHKHEDDALHTDLPPVHKLPPESVEEFTGQSVKVADDAVEAMEVSVGSQSSRPDEERLLSGLRVLTEVCTVVLQGSWLHPWELYID